MSQADRPQPLISVILPTRDRPRLLLRALASVLAQAAVRVEVIVVDNNQSAPPVRQQAEGADGLLLRDPRVKIVEARAAGTAGQARNAGLENASGEWVSFLDDDDEYASEKLAKQLAAASRHHARLVLCGYEVRLGARVRRIQLGQSEFAGDELLLSAVWGTPFLFLHRSVMGAFPERIRSAEDLYFAQSILSTHRIDRVPNVPEPLVRVYLQGDGRVNAQHDEHWRGMRATAARFGHRYSREARRRFLLRAVLQREKGPGGAWARLFAAGWRLVWMEPRESRRVLNAWLLRTGMFNRWLVS